MRLKNISVVAVLAAAIASAAAGAEVHWSEVPAVPAQGIEGAFVSAVAGQLVVAGGIRSQDGQAVADAWILDSPDGAWRKTTALPEAAGFGAAAALGERSIFVGGSAGARGPYRSAAYTVHLAGGELAYEPLPELPEARAYGAGAILNGIFHMVGGASAPAAIGEGAPIWALDLGALEPAWEPGPTLSAPQRLSPSLAAQDGALFLFGGTAAVANADDPESTQSLTDAYRYSPSMGWKAISNVPARPMGSAAAPLGPTHIALRAGASSDADVMAYHTVTDTWIDLSAVPDISGDGFAVAWGDRIVFSGMVPDAAGSSHRLFAMEVAPPSAGFSAVDYITLFAYFGVLVMMGIYFAGKGSGTEDFFLAGRRMPWWATGLSIFGTQLSSISFMAVPAKVYATDWVYFLLQMTIIMVAFPVVFLYLPHFRRRRMTSAYEYLERRFNLPVRLYASVSFVLYQLGRMAIVLFLPAMALSTVTGFSVYSCILVMGVLSTLYTVMGGMRAVIWTDVVQVFVLYGGALLSLVVLLAKTDGGLGTIISEGIEYDKFHMFNWTWDWTTTAVWVVLVGNFFLNLVPYTSDQAVVQRYFTTKDEKTAAKSIWTNAILLVPSTLTLFLLGTSLWAFYRANPELLNPALPTDSIFPLFISQQLPAGIAGLLIAAVFAASMSTLDSSLNSVSAALVTDFYVRFEPEASDASRLRLARWLTAGLGVLATATSIALATFDVGSLWDTFQGMMGLLGGGLAGLFALGIFFRSANGGGAMTGAICSVFILYWVQQHSDLHFFLYGAVGILSCVIIALATSPVFATAKR